LTLHAFLNFEVIDMAQDSTVTVSARFVFSVLRLVATANKPLGVTEISRHLSVPVNKAYRAAVTLENVGYLRRHASRGGFEIGAVAEQLVYAGFQVFRVRAAITPYLRQIATSAEATTSLAVRIGWYSVTLAFAESGSNVISRAQRFGRATLLDSDVGGLAILAWLMPAEIKRFLSFAAQHLSKSDLSASAYQKRLAAFKRAGFATASANNKRVQALGIPLRDVKGSPLGSITVEALVGRDIPLQADPLLKQWLEIVAQAEAVLHANPGQFATPYAFLDPDDIQFYRF
jgi:DNA-binding IclR family transcriptional regulator